MTATNYYEHLDTADDDYGNPDRLVDQLGAERLKCDQVAKSIQDVNDRRHTCNRLVNPGFSYQAALRQYGLQPRAYNLFDGARLVFANASFNHATGWLYRAQAFGHADVDVFTIQKRLRALDKVQVGDHIARSV